MNQGENVAVVVGFATEPELGKSSSGTPLLKFRVAVNEMGGRAGKRYRKTDWIPVVVWGKYGETLAGILTKGQQVSVFGKNRVYRQKGGAFGYHIEAGRVVLLGNRKVACDETDNVEQGLDDEGNVDLPFDLIDADSEGQGAEAS